MKWAIKNIGLLAIAFAIFSAGAPVTEYLIKQHHDMMRIETAMHAQACTTAFAQVSSSALNYALKVR